MITGELAFPVSSEGSARQQAMQVIVSKQGHAPLDPGTRFHDDLRKLIRDMTEASPHLRITSMQEVERRIRALRRLPLGHAGVTLMPLSDADIPLPPDNATPVIPDDVALETEMQAAVPAPHSRVPRRLVALGAGLGMLTIVAMGAAVTSAWQATLPPLQAAAVTVSGDLPVDVTLDGQPADRQEGRTLEFGEVLAGPVVLQWAAGDDACTVRGCLDLLDRCPEGCLTGEVEVEIMADGELWAYTLELPPHPGRDLELALPRLAATTPVSGTLARQVGTRTDAGLAFTSVPPGSSLLRVEVGTCEPSASPCFPRWRLLAALSSARIHSPDCRGGGGHASRAGHPSP